MPSVSNKKRVLRSLRSLLTRSRVSCRPRRRLYPLGNARAAVASRPMPARDSIVVSMIGP